MMNTQVSVPFALSRQAEKPTEYKTVQAPILAYAQEIGWTYVPRGEAAAAVASSRRR
jgi:hypothetical protein